MRHSLKDQFLIEFKSLFSGYPDFVYSGKNDGKLDGIPVFVFHSIEPELFESQLKYLKNNNYHSLSIHDFYNSISKTNKVSQEKKVLLTIDDARSSVWRFAYPLLKKYQMSATVFVIPGITEMSEHSRKNLEDFWNGTSSIKDIYEQDKADNTLCNWQEIKLMYSSGYVKIESHTLFHREIFVNNRIRDFIGRETSFIPYNFNGSPYYSREMVGKSLSQKDFLGLPLFDSAPLMLAGPKLSVSQDFIHRCKEIYNDCSNKNDEWKQRVSNIVNDDNERDKNFQIIANSKTDVLEDLILARQIIQENLDTDAGNHLCLPWTRGNTETIKICRQLGIKSCFWGVLPNKKINKPGDDPNYISRIKNDFIFRLPGINRKSLISIYGYKMKRRLSREQIY
jgi:hypothetical protein